MQLTQFTLKHDHIVQFYVTYLGVFDDGDDDMVELMLSEEEQLQKSLDVLRDDVLQHHRDVAATVGGKHQLFVHLKGFIFESFVQYSN